MPDRMSEYMSDSLPEYIEYICSNIRHGGDHTKSSNFMGLVDPNKKQLLSQQLSKYYRFKPTIIPAKMFPLWQEMTSAGVT